MKRAVVAVALLGVPAFFVWSVTSAPAAVRDVVLWVFGAVCGALLLAAAWVMAGEVIVLWGNERRRRRAVREYRARERAGRG